MRALALALVVGAAWSGAASASSYIVTFLGNPMAPAGAEKGIPFVTKILAKWKIPSLPGKGQCLQHTGLPGSYTDGIDTPKNLKAAGFKAQSANTYLYLCTDAKTGKVTSGNYEINMVQGDAFTANYAVYTSNGNVNNGQFISSDVEMSYVVNGVVTQYYDVSSAPVAAFRVRITP